MSINGGGGVRSNGMTARIAHASPPVNLRSQTHNQLTQGSSQKRAALRLLVMGL